MRLLFDVPAGWQRREAPERELYLIAADPGLTMEVGALVEAADFPEDLLARGLAPGHKLSFFRALRHRTAVGWPLQLQEALVVDAAGAVVEVRLLAAYSLLIYATAILVRAAEPGILDRHRAAILDVMESARPELRSGPPAAIAELWSMAGAP